MAKGELTMAIKIQTSNPNCFIEFYSGGSGDWHIAIDTLDSITGKPVRAYANLHGLGKSNNNPPEAQEFLYTLLEFHHSQTGQV